MVLCRINRRRGNKERISSSKGASSTESSHALFYQHLQKLLVSLRFGESFTSYVLRFLGIAILVALSRLFHQRGGEAAEYITWVIGLGKGGAVAMMLMFQRFLETSLMRPFLSR